MKCLYLVLLSAIILASTTVQAQWTTIGSGISPGDAAYTSIALDTNNVPYIAYQDISNNSKLTVKKFVNNSWTTVGTADFTAYPADYISIVIGPDNMPYVAYQENGGNTSGPGSKQGSVMKFDGNNWVFVGSQDFTVDESYFYSMKFDKNGTLYIAYEHDNSTTATNSPIAIKKFNGSSWVDVGTQPTISSSGSLDQVSLAFDTSGVPYVAFVDGDNGDKASVLKFNGTGWSYLGSPGFTPGEAYWTSLAIDNNNIPYVAFEDNSDNLKLSVMKYTGGTWSFAGTEGFSVGEQVQYVSMAVDPCGTPYVTYQDNGTINYSHATVNRFNDTSWDSLGVTGFTPDATAYTTLAFDKNGAPYIAYNGDNYATVMWYPTLADATGATANNTTICSGSSTTLSTGAGHLNRATQWHWYADGCGGSGTAVGTGSSLQLSPTTTTTYYVRGEGTCVEGICGNVTITVNNCNGIDQISASDISLYPNPANDKVVLEGSIFNQNNYSLMVTDINGRALQTNISRANGQVVINTASFSPGVYLVNIKTAYSAITKRLIIE